MSRLALLAGAATVAVVLSATAHAGTSAAGNKVPMHPSTLILRSGAHAPRHHRHHNYAHDTFRSPTHIHGTMAGPRM